MKRNLLAAVLVIVGILGASNSALAASGAGAINLTFPIGARYNALGEAGVALAQDVTACWWNPGGLAYLPTRPQKHDIHIMQSSLVPDLASDIALYWGGYAAPLGSAGAIGFYVNYLDMGEQIAIDEDQNERGTFSSYMFAIGAVYGLRISPNVGIGLGVKYFRDKLAPSDVIQDVGGSGSGDSFGVDLGVLWKIPSLRMNVAGTVTNLGPDIKHVDADQSDPMPRAFRTGLAYSLFSSEAMGLLLLGDFQVPLYKYDSDTNDYGFGFDTDQTEWGIGTEWNYVSSLFVRVGWKSAEYGDINAATYGFGVDLQQWLGQGIVFDWASVPQAESLSRVNRFSLAFRF